MQGISLYICLPRYLPQHVDRVAAGENLQISYAGALLLVQFDVPFIKIFPLVWNLSFVAPVSVVVLAFFSQLAVFVQVTRLLAVV